MDLDKDADSRLTGILLSHWCCHATLLRQEIKIDCEQNPSDLAGVF